jgi:hypothetical protein
MNHKFQNILDDGEIKVEILDKVIYKMGDINDLDVKTSNCTSFVFISSEKENVYQYFCFNKIFKRICTIILSLNNKIIVDQDYKYNLNNYLSNFIDSYENDNIIVWKKHICLNSFSDDYLNTFICNNITKILWDISHSLYGLHQNNISHGDCRIDNIGISDGKFILFDFDGSFSQESSFNYSKDLYDLITSIKYRLDKTFSKIQDDIPSYYGISDLLKSIIYLQKNDYQKKSTDEIINKLNNMEIIY